MPRFSSQVSGFVLLALLGGCSQIPGMGSKEPPRQVGERRAPINNAETMAQIAQAASRPVPVTESAAREATGVLRAGEPVQGFAQASQYESPPAPSAEDGRRVPMGNPGGVLAGQAEAHPAAYPQLSSVPEQGSVTAPAPGATDQTMASLAADRDRVAGDAAAMNRSMQEEQIGQAPPLAPAPMEPVQAEAYEQPAPRPIITTSEPVTPREPVVREIVSAPPPQEPVAEPQPEAVQASAPRELMPAGELPPAPAASGQFADPNGAISTTPIAVAPPPPVAAAPDSPFLADVPPAEGVLRAPAARNQRFLPESRYAARRAAQRMAQSGF